MAVPHKSATLCLSLPSLLLGWMTAASALAQTPYPTGIPHPIPGVIEAENFDQGEDGDAFHDLDSVNEGGEYRPAQGVDIGAMPGGNYYVGWTKAGEWLEYSVNVTAGGLYDVGFLISDDLESGGTLHLEMNGNSVTGTVNIVPTGGWANYATVTAQNVYLRSGEQVLRIALDSQLTYGQCNIDRLTFTRIDTQDFLVTDLLPGPQSHVVFGARNVRLGTVSLNNPGDLEISLSTLRTEVRSRSGESLTPGEVFSRYWIEDGSGVVAVLQPPFPTGGLFQFTPVRPVPGHGSLSWSLHADVLAAPAQSELSILIPDHQSLNGGQVFLEPAPGRALPLSTGQINLREPALAGSFSAFPNPFRPSQESLAVVYHLESEGHVLLRLYTIDGRLVRTLLDNVLPAGMQAVRWDGRNDQGLTVQSGIYLLQLRVRTADVVTSVRRQIALVR